MPRRPNFPPSPHRQLTRARKLRYLEDHEVYDLDFGVRKSPRRDRRGQVNAAEASTSTSRSSVDISNGVARISTAVPLPLPDLALLLSGGRSKEFSGGFRLPSPEEVKKGDREKARRERNRENPSEVADSCGASPISRISQRDARINEDAQRNVGYSETWLSGNMTKNVMGVDRVQEGFGRQAPVRSAPVTTYSSPMASPRRSGAADLASSFHEVSYARETLWKDMASQERRIDSFEVLNPASPVRMKNTTYDTSPVRPKLYIDTSNVHFIDNCPLGGYPLPLPPGAATQSPSYPSTQSSPNPQISAQSFPLPQLSGQSSPSFQITPRPEFLLHTNQWSKGKLIGRGTFGSVYVATNRKTGALCAMKEVEMCPSDSKSRESMRQLEQEIKVLSNLKHPNIVQYYGSEIVDDSLYIYLEYVHPGSINNYVWEHCGDMTESVVRNFTKHILSGLAYLHGTKTIHRDIKGANLLVDASGVVKLADFGMAKHLTGQAADLSLKGSPHWMAPELMQAVMKKDNSSDLAFAVDIWSLGCTVIEMFSGKPPWSEYEGAAAMFKVMAMRESPPIPETLSAEGKDFLRCCFQRNPAQRPSASKLLEHRFVMNSHSI